MSLGLTIISNLAMTEHLVECATCGPFMAINGDRSEVVEVVLVHLAAEHDVDPSTVEFE